MPKDKKDGSTGMSYSDMTKDDYGGGVSEVGASRSQTTYDRKPGQARGVSPEEAIDTTRNRK